MKDFNDESHFPIIKIISSRIQINMLFKTKDERKIIRCDRNKHKAMRITVYIHKRIKNSLLQFNQK